MQVHLPGIVLLILALMLPGCNSRSRQQEAVTEDSIPATDPRTQAALRALDSSFHAFRKDPCMEDACIGYMIVDCSGPKPSVLAEHLSSKAMIPASTLKLFVTGAALEIFGEPVVPEVMTINQLSINWRSSKLLRRIGKEVYGESTNANGYKAILNFWEKKGLHLEGIRFDDGNGLSRNNAISPGQLVELLTVMRQSPWFHVFYSSLPVAGYTGTMKKTLAGTPGAGKVRAKTGSIAGVKSLAGYVSSSSGKQLAFAVIINDFTCKKKVMRKYVEDFLLKMTEL